MIKWIKNYFMFIGVAVTLAVFLITFSLSFFSFKNKQALPAGIEKPFFARLDFSGKILEKEDRDLSITKMFLMHV